MANNNNNNNNNTLTLQQYQQQAMTTCMDSSRNFAYMMFNLIAEVAEACEKAANFLDLFHKDINLNHSLHAMARYGHEFSTIAKRIRKDTKSSEALEAEVIDTFLNMMKPHERELLQKELGDCLWQLSGVNSVLNLDLADTAVQNLDKLASRKQRNKIDGDGDER